MLTDYSLLLSVSDGKNGKELLELFVINCSYCSSLYFRRNIIIDEAWQFIIPIKAPNRPKLHFLAL